MQQSEENQKARLVPEVRNLRANVTALTHERDVLRNALDAKDVERRRCEAEHKLELAQAKQEKQRVIQDRQEHDRIIVESLKKAHAEEMDVLRRDLVAVEK